MVKEMKKNKVNELIGGILIIILIIVVGITCLVHQSNVNTQSIKKAKIVNNANNPNVISQYSVAFNDTFDLENNLIFPIKIVLGAKENKVVIENLPIDLKDNLDFKQDQSKLVLSLKSMSTLIYSSNQSNQFINNNSNNQTIVIGGRVYNIQGNHNISIQNNHVYVDGVRLHASNTHNTEEDYDHIKITVYLKHVQSITNVNFGNVNLSGDVDRLNLKNNNTGNINSYVKGDFLNITNQSTGNIDVNGGFEDINLTNNSAGDIIIDNNKKSNLVVMNSGEGNISFHGVGGEHLNITNQSTGNVNINSTFSDIQKVNLGLGEILIQ
jgi:hypothetical protein